MLAAIDVAASNGDGLAVATSSAAKATIAARSGQWRTAPRASADAAERGLQLADMITLGQSHWAAVLALAALGHLEPAAMLAGLADLRWNRSSPWVIDKAELVASADAALLECLAGLDAALRDRGAALEAAEAVAVLRGEADRVLGDEPAH